MAKDSYSCILFMDIRIRTREFVAAALILLSTISVSQASTTPVIYPEQIKFQHVLQNRDLVTGEVRTIYQSRDGFLWIGGWRGFWRFDGYEFLPIEYEYEQNGTVVREAQVNSTDIAEDKHGNLWISTINGIAKLDKQKYIVSRLPDDINQPLLVSANFIHQIENLPNGDLIAISGGNQNAIIIINPETEKYEAIIANSSNEESTNSQDKPTNAELYAVEVLTNGDIWIGHSLGLDKFNWRTRKFEYFPLKYNNESVWVRDIASDGEGNLWLASPQGVHKYNIKKSRLTSYQHAPKESNALGSNDVWQIFVDSSSRVWATTDQGGLNLYHEPKDEFIRYNHIPGKYDSLASNVVRTVYEDRNGDLWVGLYPDGVDYFDQSTVGVSVYTSNPTDTNSLSHNSILAISEDSEGNLWLGTDGGGLNYFDRKNKTFKQYKHIPEREDTIASNAVLCSLIDSHNILWLGHWNGAVSRMDLNTREITRVPFFHPAETIESSDKINSSHVWNIFEDKNGTLWFATHSGGLNRYDRETERFIYYEPESKAKPSITSEWVWSLYEDSHDHLWVGTTIGLNRMDREKGTFEHYLHDQHDSSTLSSPIVYDMHESKDGRFYIATSNGLDLFNRDKGTFSRLDAPNALFNDSVRSVVEDENGLLWLGTAGGVATLNPDTLEVKNYNRDSGKLIGTMGFNAGILSSNGEVILGGANGLRIYRPNELKGNMLVPPIAFTALRLFSEIVQVDNDDELLKQDINYTNEIVLDYTQSMIEFEFSALNFRDSSKNQYQYMLEGFDSKWLKVGSQRTAKYTNLDAGRYVFKVQASNNDGIWNTKGRQITVIQQPAPWKTWWAYTIYILLIVFKISSILYDQVKKRRMTEELNRQLEEKVKDRTKRLQEKTNDINSILQNMHQGVFTITENNTIHPEYSQYLEEIFETKELAGLDAFDFLFKNSDLTADRVAQLYTVVSSSFGYSLNTWGFNIHLLISEYKLKFEDERLKILEVEWNPIADKETNVTKILVTVRDVTQVRELKKQAEKQKLELDIVGQIISISPDKFSSFIERTLSIANENRALIEDKTERNDDALAKIFRNIHTLKGNSRTYGLDFLANTAHEVEQYYTELRDNEELAWDQTILLEKQEIVDKQINHHLKIFEERLAPYMQHKQKEEAAAKNFIQKITDYIISDNFANAKQLVNNMQACQFHECLEDLSASLEELANSLEKLPPNIEIDTKGLSIKKEFVPILQDVFTHIFRNALDHGIETEQKRLASGKNAKGTINVQLDKNKQDMTLIIKDDGKGLAIGKLREKFDQTDNDLEIANSIFRSGVSTAETTTEISGRGVGMDAVKSFLVQQGGDISIELTGTEKDGYRPFELHLKLPNEAYFLA